MIVFITEAVARILAGTVWEFVRAFGRQMAIYSVMFFVFAPMTVVLLFLGFIVLFMGYNCLGSVFVIGQAIQVAASNLRAAVSRPYLSALGFSYLGRSSFPSPTIFLSLASKIRFTDFVESTPDDPSKILNGAHYLALTKTLELEQDQMHEYIAKIDSSSLTVLSEKLLQDLVTELQATFCCQATHA